MPTDTPLVHSPDNLPIVPPGLPPSDPGAQKVALDQNQLRELADRAGTVVNTVKAYWPAIVLLAGACYGGGKVDLSTVLKSTPTNTPVVDASRMDKLDKRLSDLTDVVVLLDKKLASQTKKGN